ncbi:hypothetical protein OH76DRAFT_1399108 [Lentinus brumalis]|uniref:Uncharacterized protein n=1 Tax=Lentinus brumalis TaxID=2498619 RepID=A0A371DN06_9APHY|nr:hypothetical protein OH76DRAFT_1399108 [Polyporus brumalis]
MCCRRQVRTLYKRCNHGVTSPDELIQCFGTKCIFSPNHPRSCTGAECKKRCWQYRSAPQQYTEEKQAYCPNCVAAGYH